MNKSVFASGAVNYNERKSKAGFPQRCNHGAPAGAGIVVKGYLIRCLNDSFGAIVPDFILLELDVIMTTLMRYLRLVSWIFIFIMGLSACSKGGSSSSQNNNICPAPSAASQFVSHKVTKSLVSQILPALSGISLSGTISTAPGTAVDNDVNDPLALYESNDTTNAAQVIINPVTLGGYVNVANFGPGGRSISIGDTDDYFKTTLAASQVIVMRVIDGTALVSLTLEDLAGAVVQNSTTGGTTQRISVTSSGTFLVHVRANSGASKYVLSIGIGAASIAASANADLKADDDFVPGDIIVRFNDQIVSAAQAGLPARAAVLNLNARAGATGRDMLLSLGDITQTRTALAMLGIPSLAIPATDSIQQKKQDTIAAIVALRARDDVLSARPNYIRKALREPDDTYYARQWNYPLMNLPLAWEVTTGARDFIVAVVDTGVLLNHPDLQGQLVQGYDFIRNTASARDGDGIDSNPDDVGDGDGVSVTSSFHGTHVAGTIAATTNNARGVAGIGWNVKVMPIRVLGRDGGEDYDIEQGIRYAAGLPNDGETAEQTAARVNCGMVADVINMSLGGPTNSTTPPQAFVDARNAGVIIVAAAGNESSSGPSWPASLDGVVSVSAVDLNKNLAFYSNFGSTVDVAAPGGDGTVDLNGDTRPDGILSTLGDDSKFDGTIQFGYGIYQGTSMASPHVAGVVALMKAVKPDLTPGDFDAYLVSGNITEDLGATGRDDNYGYGFIDAYKAVIAAGGAVPVIPAHAAVSPGALNFSYSRDTMTFTISNEGNQSFNSVSAAISYGGTEGWLSVTPTVDVVGTYTAKVDRSVLNESTDNVHVATIVVATDANTVNVPVIMALSNLGISDSAGYQYVLLLDINATPTVDNTQQLEMNPSNGKYAYQFNNVEPGDYVVLAGSDNDNDFILCDDGEACGIYPDVARPTRITVISGQDSVTNLNFQTGYSSLLNGLSVQGAITMLDGGGVIAPKEFRGYLRLTQ